MHLSGSTFLAAVLLVVGVVGLYIFNSQNNLGSSEKSSGDPETPKSERWYATTDVNVRAGPGTSYETIGELSRRDGMEVAFDSSTKKWAARYDDTQMVVDGYVSKSYLSRNRPEPKDWIRVTRSNFSGNWPFTVSSGEIGCKMDQEPDFNGGTDYVEVPVFRAEGTTYALTGHGESMGHRSVRPIWRESPGPSPKVSLSGIRRKAKQICP